MSCRRHALGLYKAFNAVKRVLGQAYKKQNIGKASTHGGGL